MRTPYQAPRDDDGYSHQEDASEFHQLLWARAVWMVGDSIVRSFVQCGWFAGLSDGGQDAGDELPRHTFRDYDSGSEVTIGPIEQPISYARERELAELGFTPVVESADGRVVVNFSSTPFQQESLNRTGSRKAERSFAADFRGLLCACRFAQVVSRLARRLSERELQRWLDAYVATQDQIPDATRPLRSASVRLEQRQQKFFVATAELRIWPAYQFDASEPINLLVRLDALYPQSTEMETSASEVTPTKIGFAELNEKSHEPFYLASAAPSREPHAVLEAFWRSLDETGLPRCRLALGPLTIDALVDATRPIEELVEWVCREDVRLDIAIADAPHSTILDLPRLGFLIRYPSGAVRGLAAEIESVEGRYKLSILDPLALLDPEGLVPTGPTEPLLSRFDVLVLEAMDDDQA
jgi:hypothetical protein